MEKDIKEAFEELGLSDKESSLYLALLEMGESPVQKLAERSGLNRVTVYPLLTSLTRKGFVSQFSMERKSYFKAIPPKQILDLIKVKEQKVKLVLPMLEAKAERIKSSTSLELFKGEKGIASFLEKLYSGGDKELWAYGNGQIIEKAIEYQSLNARNLRISKKIKLNFISSPTKADYLQNPKYKSLTNIKFNEKLKDMNVYIIFGKEIVGILELSKELTGIIIENEEIARYHKFVFNMLK